MDELDVYLELLGELYGATVDPVAWPQVLARIRAMFAGTGIDLLPAERYGDPGFISTSLADGRMPESGNCAMPVDPVSGSEALHRVVYAHTPETELTRERAADDRGSTSPGPAAVEDEVHPVHARQADERTVALLSRLVPHLGRAMHLAARFNALTLGCLVMENVADQLLFGVYVLDASGTVLHHNTAAGEIAAAGDGIRIEARCLRMSSSKAQLGYEAVLAEVTGQHDDSALASPSVITVLRPTERRPYTLRVFPVLTTVQSPVLRRAVAVVFVTDPERASRPASGAIARALGLTPREAELALELAAGYSVADAAGRLGITSATARSYLKLIFRKTRVNRQGELVRLVLSTAMTFPENDASPVGCPILQ